MATSFRDFVSKDDPDYDWLIPGLLEKQDRLLLTAREGKGKSTLLRQIGVMAAIGIHPFTLEPIAPVPTLYVDLESGVRHVRRKMKELAQLAARAGHEQPEQLWVECRPNGADLTRDEGVKWLENQLIHARPSLVIIGPLYKMVTGDPSAEEPAKALSGLFDQMREKLDCAIVIEAHSAKPAPGYNPTTPYGASLWMRWPEFGLYLSAKGEVKHWRGPRDERDWPQKLTWGETWPWIVASDTGEELWNAVKKVAVEAGRKVSQRELANRLGTSQATVSRCIGKGGDHEADWVKFSPAEHINVGDDDGGF